MSVSGLRLAMRIIEVSVSLPETIRCTNQNPRYYFLRSFCEQRLFDGKVLMC